LHRTYHAKASDRRNDPGHRPRLAAGLLENRDDFEEQQHPLGVVLRRVDIPPVHDHLDEAGRKAARYDT
jgi:hypothetical protein